MNAQDWIGILEAIPELIRFLYPGSLTIWLYSFFRGYSIKESRGFIVRAIEISYLYNVIVEYILHFEMTAPISFNLALVVIAIVSPYICYHLIESELFAIFLEAFEIKTSTKADEISLMIADQIYTYVRVYLRAKDIVYEGYVKNYDLDNSKSDYIILSQIEKLHISHNPYKEELITGKDFKNDDHEWVLLYLKDIERIEKRNIDKL